MKKFLIITTFVLMSLNLNAARDLSPSPTEVETFYNNVEVDTKKDISIKNEKQKMGSIYIPYVYKDYLTGKLKYPKFNIGYYKITSDIISDESNTDYKMKDELRKECNKNINFTRKSLPPYPSKSSYLKKVRDGNENYTYHWCHPLIPVVVPDSCSKKVCACCGKGCVNVPYPCTKTIWKKDPGHPYPCTKSRPKYKMVVDYSRYNKAVRAWNAEKARTESLNRTIAVKENEERRRCLPSVHKSYLSRLINSDLIDYCENPKNINSQRCKAR